MTLLSVPHHDGSSLYVSDAAPVLGRSVSVWVLVPDAAGVDRVFVRSTPDGEPAFGPAEVDRVAAGETWWRAEVVVRNPVTRYRFLLDGPAGPLWLNALGLFAHDVPDVADYRLLAWDPPPAWALDAVIYEVFPDRFARSGSASGRALPEWAIPCAWDTPVIGRGPETPYQFYGGDLDGIAEHLDHIESLGATAIYLTPVFPARSNHRYDASSFARVDPLLGGDEALARLAAAAHGRGMRVIGDLTTNHCGDAHPWFASAMADRTAIEREMFYLDGDDYESWCGVKSLPKLNWGSAELRRRFLVGPDSVAQRFLRPPFGLDGWRIDVANMTGRRGAESYTNEVASLMRRAVREARSDGLIVAEHAHDASDDLDRDGWHGTMNYAGFTRPLWCWLRSGELGFPDFLGAPGGVPLRGGADAAATMRWFGATASWRSITHSWNLLGSHDTARIRTVVGDSALFEVALGLLMTMPGVPMVFAGDEIGLEGTNGEDARRPMPWQLPESWNRSTLEHCRTLIGIRRSHEALRRGGLRWAYVDEDTIAFLREAQDEQLLVYARRAPGAPVCVRGLPGVPDENLLGGATTRSTPDGAVQLPGDGPTIQIWRLRPAA